MTEQLLWDALEDAQDKGQLGLFIWANWTVWDDYAHDMQPGNEIYDSALSQISNEEEATVQFKFNELSTPGIIAVSVPKMNSSDEFILKVLDTCKKGHYEGPITLVPSNKVCAFS